MTSRAGWIGAMRFHQLPHGLRGAASRRGIFQWRNVGWRVGWNNAQNIGHHPFAALHRGRPVGNRRHQFDTALAQQATAYVKVAVQLHSPELAAINVWDSVM